MIADMHGRTIRYLRLSLTPACDMRCVYCRPASASRASTAARLSADEIDQLVRHLAGGHGLRKVRLTGGEPTRREDLLDIVRRLARIEALSELAMTTNGATLERQAKPLADAGLQRVNISLDSLDPRRFQRITGVNALDRVLRGVDAAQGAGLPVKLNTVVLCGENDEELPQLLRFAARHALEIRFIELMPMGPLAGQWADRFVSAKEMRGRLIAVVRRWTALPPGDAPARVYQAHMIDGTTARVGFIAAMSCPFCDGCSRIRIASDGRFYPCLMDRPQGNVLCAIRPHLDAQALDELLSRGLRRKASEHPCTGAAVMTAIGG